MPPNLEIRNPKMPIDPSIALNIRPVQAVNPLETIGNVMALRNAQQQNLIGQERLKQEQLANRETALKQNDDQVASQTFLQANGDPNTHVQLMAKAGARPQAIQAVQQHYGALAKQAADTDATKLGNNLKRNEQILPLHDAALQAIQDGTIGQQWPALFQAAAAIDPEVAKHFSPDQPPTAQQIQASKNSHLLQDYTLKAEKEKRDQAEALRQQSEEQRKAQLFAPQLTEAQTKATTGLLQTDSAALANAASQGPAALAAALSKLPADRRAPFSGLTAQAKPADILKLGLTPEQQMTTGQQAANAVEQARHNAELEKEAKGRLGVEQGSLALRTKENALKYGDGTVDFWAHQIESNPDSIKELPAELRSAVGRAFSKNTGLPLPTALSGQTQQQETASRNALDNINFIRQAVKNPEIQKQLGPIMGRLGNAEQAIGTAAGLSPEAEKLAQELRTRMRYFVFQEGKAVLGGRLPSNLMKSLEESSGSVKMDPSMLKGALSGAEGSAQSILDNADRQRFGGKMRSRDMRSGKITVTAPDGSSHPFDTQAQADAFKKLAGIK